MKSPINRVSRHQVISKWICVVLISITILIALGPFGCGATQVATEADVRKAVNDAIPLMPDLSVTSESVPIIDRDTQEKAITYLVESKLVDQYWFNVTDYRLDRRGDRTTINLDQMAKDIDRAYETHTPFAEGLTGSVTTGVSAGPYASGSVTISGPLKAILELLGLIKGVTKPNIERVEVAIKGYADGEKSKDWPRIIDNLPEQFRRFQVLSPTEEQNENWFFYRKPEIDREIFNPYSNDDLPDLRAQYVRKEFVEPFVQRCDNKDRCHIYVLHNKALREPEKPQWRKAQVYLMVYLKRQPQ